MGLYILLLKNEDKNEILNFGFPQEAAKESKAALLSPDDAEDAESPLPSNIIQPVRISPPFIKDKDNHHTAGENSFQYL